MGVVFFCTLFVLTFDKEMLDNILHNCRIVNEIQKLNKFRGQYETKNYYVSGFGLDGMWFILFTAAKSSLCC